MKLSSRCTSGYLLILLALGTNSVSADCVISMVYKDGAKAPLIEEMPKNDGVFNEIFSEAAQRIGCKLDIQRLPKKRLHLLLEEGKLDFYPGASFSEDRAHYLYYLPNGMDTGEYGVTNLSMKEIGSYDELKKLNVIWLMEIGGSPLELANSLGVPIQERKFFDLPLVSKFVERSPNINYFYIADKELVEYFPRLTGKSLEQAGLKVHKNCCGGDLKMYAGFSRFSPHFKEIPNPDYDKSKKLTPENFPVKVDESCVAAKLGKALVDMETEGMTDKIYSKWFFK